MVSLCPCSASARQPRVPFPSGAWGGAMLAAPMDPFLAQREGGRSGEDRVAQSLWLRG